MLGVGWKTVDSLWTSNTRALCGGGGDGGEVELWGGKKPFNKKKNWLLLFTFSLEHLHFTYIRKYR